MPRRLVLTLIAVLTLAGIASATYVAVNSPLNALRADEDFSVPAVSAKKASQFTDSVGINIHAYYTPIPWDNYVSALDDLGITYVRDDLSFNYADYTSHNGYGSNWIEKLKQLKSHGVTTLAIAEELKNTPAEVTSFVKLSQGAIGIVSGPNEVNYQCAPDGTNFTGQIYVLCPDNLWLGRTLDYMSALRGTLKADSATKNVTIYSPSINPTNSNGANGFAATADAGDIHHYPYLIDETPSTIKNIFNAAAPVYPGRPMVMTEIGYPSQPSNIANRPANEQLQAAILPMYLLENYHAGVSRTFLYELVDLHSSNNYFGLLDEPSGRRKPAFSAIQNLMSLLKDTGSNFTPSYLRYQLGGNSSGVTSQLFQKSDGSFYIAMWQSALTNSPTPLPNQAISTKDVTVQFGNDLQSASIIDPSSSSTPIETFNRPTAISHVSIGLDPIVIQIFPAPPSSQSGGTSNSGTTSQTTGTAKKKATSKTPASTAITPAPTISAPSVPTATDSSFNLPNSQSTSAQSWWQHIKEFFKSIWQWIVQLFHK